MTTAESIARLDALRKSKRELLESLRTVAEQIREVELQIIADQHGVTIGTIVTFKGKPYRVTRVEAMWKRPWLYGAPRRKDGTWGTRARCLFDAWTVSTEEVARTWNT